MDISVSYPVVTHLQTSCPLQKRTEAFIICHEMLNPILSIVSTIKTPTYLTGNKIEAKSCTVSLLSAIVCYLPPLVTDDQIATFCSLKAEFL